MVTDVGEPRPSLFLVSPPSRVAGSFEPSRRDFMGDLSGELAFMVVRRRDGLFPF